MRVELKIKAMTSSNLANCIFLMINVTVWLFMIINGLKSASKHIMDQMHNIACTNIIRNVDNFDFEFSFYSKRS